MEKNKTEQRNGNHHITRRASLTVHLGIKGRERERLEAESDDPVLLNGRSHEAQAGDWSMDLKILVAFEEFPGPTDS
ncbi:hypothetical protein OPV22_014155 [Ensete ventricosum]|uniref:Uncharacterized protein n=1 Tax=Ensete ventricosum TaxID=4639 RepID=A0AAV8R2M3_ENSVE|nr:hypothetical protein OPV22_014155 [Ensete ventricosum]